MGLKKSFGPSYDDVVFNRSVPTDVLVAHLVYPNIGEAIAWLSHAFGFMEHFRYGDPAAPAGAQMRAGSACIMLMEARPGRAVPAESGSYTQSLTVFVEDVDAHFERAKSAGVQIVEDLHETMYGERQYGAVDLAGHHWLFSRHVRDVNPAEWGATVSGPGAAMATQISPMLAVTDGAAAIEFYQAAFGAEVRWRLGFDEHIVAGLSVHGAQFFLATESPEYGTRGPSGAGFTTVRIELFIDDPAAVQKRALAAGAREHSPVVEHTHPTQGPSPIKRMLQGAVTDPFGHLWLIGKILE